MSERYVLLLRESDPKGAKEACESQQHALENEVRARGGHVVDVVADLGYSGAILDRPAIEQLLDLAERRAMDVVLATELARLSRAEPAGFYMLRAELAANLVRLEFLDQSWSDDPDDEAAPLLEGIAVALPRVERRRITRRFQRGKERVWAAGFHWAPTPPYGFRYHKGGSPRPDRAAPGWWEIREDEAQWVRHMYRLAADGLTLGEIGRWLLAQGAPTRKGGQWWPRTILGILRNPINYGLLAGRHSAVRAVRPYQPRKARPSVGKAGKGRRQVKTSYRLLPAGSWRGPTLRPELAIVSKADFDRALAARQKNRQTSPRTKNPSLLAGLVVCGCHDGGPHSMYYSKRGGGRPAFWRCPYRAGIDQPYCKSYVHADLLEAAVWGRLLALATQPDALLRDMVQRLAQQSAQAAKASRRTSVARAQVQAAEDYLDNLARAHYRGELERERYLRLRGEAEGERAQALRALAAAEEEAARWDQHPLPGAPDALLVHKDALVASYVADTRGEQELVRGLVYAALGDPKREDLQALPLEEKRRRIKRLVERVIVEGREAHLVCTLTGRRDQLSVHHRYSTSGASGRMDRPVRHASSALSTCCAY
jgi:DNA invertase Pin-like site-specific DNA recombinase